MRLIECGIISSANDLARLKIIDYGRAAYCESRHHAKFATAKWLINHTIYYKIEDDLTQYEERSDWKKWSHPGNHPLIGKLYWNWFHSLHTGKLVFGDEPDFWGHYETDNGLQKFWGDIGKVSATTFLWTITKLGQNDIWISVVDSKTQVLLCPLYNIREVFQERFCYSPQENAVKNKPAVVPPMILSGNINEDGKLVVDLPLNLSQGRVVVQVLQP
jgi:hypothetical protein